MKQIPKAFTKWAKEHFKDSVDKIDFHAEYDRELDVESNKQIFEHKFKPYFCPSESEISNELKAQEEMRRTEQEKQLREEEAKLIEEWKNQPTEKVDVDEFEIAKHLILSVVKGYSNAVLVFGEGGLGKTFLTINTVKEVTKDYVYYNGYTTPLSLYMFLYDNRDKLIILDDVEGIFSDNKAAALLKGAAWDADGKRLVTYQSTSKEVEGIPFYFEFKGRLIILCNKVPNEKDVSVSAMLSRFVTYKLDFSYGQKVGIMMKILEKKSIDEQKKAIIKGIILKHTSLVTENFNFRTLEKLINFVDYSEGKAEDLFRATTEENEYERMVVELMQNEGLSTGEQVERFVSATGRSRRTYFNIKRALRKKCRSAAKD